MENHSPDPEAWLENAPWAGWCCCAGAVAVEGGKWCLNSDPMFLISGVNFVLVGAHVALAFAAAVFALILIEQRSRFRCGGVLFAAVVQCVGAWLDLMKWVEAVAEV